MSDPTVGELLAAADHAALQLVGATEPNDALPLAAGWADVLDAAYQVLAAIPEPAVGERPVDGTNHYLTTRLEQMAGQAHRFNPIDVQPHPTAGRVAETLQQAADLLRRHAHPGMVRSPEGRADAAAARVRVARTVAALAHVTGGEMQAYAQQSGEGKRAAQRTRAPARVLQGQALTRWVRILQRHEQQALDYVTGHLRDLDGEQRGPAAPVSAFGVAVASWSTQAIRRAADPHVSGADLQHIAHAENALLKAAAVLTSAAIERGELDPAAGRHLHRRLQATAAGWATVAGQWGWACTPDAPRAAATTTRESATLHVAIEATTRSANSWAGPRDVAQRLAGLDILPVVRTITDGSDTLAEMYQQLPGELRDAGRLRASAGILLQIGIDSDAANRARLGPRAVTADRSLKALPVNMVDVAAKRLLPLSLQACDRMHDAGAELATTAHVAHQAVCALTPTRASRRNPGPASTGHRRASMPEQHHTHRPAPGPGITF